ncbi:MAG: protein-glutamate O-methyltransferase [Candidatus Omnitrophica bacterium]|nr:protein-glutamate O-methyltransferase [Candidatus Omnitrophota bacterium]
METFNEIQLTDKIYKKFADFIYQESGIHLGDNKQQLLKTRFQKRIRHLGLNSFEEYYETVTKNKNSDEFVFMLDAVSTNYTFFFREKDHFDFLSQKAIPEILNQKKNKGINKMRAWCAASSTGEEPYTIMICLMELISNLHNWDLKMLATDLSTKVLAKAKNGIYEKKQLQSMPPILISKYFDRIEREGCKYYHVKPLLKNYITYARFNLMSERFPFKGKFDFIFCRNVMIYFDRPTQETLVNKLANFLEPRGYLFIGHSETLPVSTKSYLKSIGPALYQKIG